MICDTCEKYPCDMDGTKLWHRCFAYSPKPKHITNADRIRSMTDEELAEAFTDVGVRTLRLHRIPVAEPVIEQAKEDWRDWLKQEADHD